VCIIRFELSFSEKLLSGWYFGLLVCAVVVMALGFESISLVTPYLLILIGLMALVLVVWLARGKAVKQPAQLFYTFTRLERVCVLGIVLMQGIALISALAPATAWDAGVAHLALPQDYVREGRTWLIDGNPYYGYPHFMHSLYSYIFYGGGELGVSLFSWMMSAFACLSVYVLGCRLKDRETGWVAALLIVLAPIYVQQAGTVSIDLAFAGLSTAALAAWMAWHDERENGYLLGVAIFAGMSCGIRHTGFVVCGILFVMTLLVERKAKNLIQFIIVGLMCSGIWMYRSYIVVGNPVYPFLTGIFGNGGMPDVQSVTVGAHETLGVSGVLDFALFPWNLVMHPERYDGWSASAGGWVLILGLPGLYWGGRRAKWIAGYSGGGLVFFYFFQRFARYALPFLMPMYAAAGATASQLPIFRRGIRWLLVFGIAYSTVMGVGSMYFKVPVVLGMESREDYLTRRVERYPAFQWVNENIPKDAVVFTLDPRTYYIDGPTYMNFQVLHELGTMSPDDQMDWFQNHGIRYVLYPVAFLEESAGYVRSGLWDVMQPWRNDPERYRLVADLEMDRTRGGGTEHVEIYEVMWNGDESL
jgi:Dolichyl-phosphate-mannose-protein mannosyltransferase